MSGARSITDTLNDIVVRPLCVHQLRHQPAQTSTAQHRRQWRNGGTSTERYSAALWSTVEQIIPPPLNQRVRGSSPWRRTPPHPADLRCLPRDSLKASSPARRRASLVHPSVGDGSDHAHQCQARHPGYHAWAKHRADARRRRHQHPVLPMRRMPDGHHQHPWLVTYDGCCAPVFLSMAGTLIASMSG
jgi:hypothetical protein